MNDNIISPTATNGITIAVMGAIGFVVIFAVAQGAMHLFGLRAGDNS